MFRTVPGFRQQFEANQARLAQMVAQRQNQRTTAINDTIAIAIHVITSASNQALITDAILKSQIDILNEDFQGKNADSTRIPAAFKSRYGKMNITFMLAQTDPSGTLTTGIERRTNAVTFNTTNYDNAKQFSTGGLDAWDPTKYLNLWVVDFGTSGLLGVSVFPGDPRPITLHGFVCDYRGFGRGASYLFTNFNKGRTTTHELGHFLNCRHIWGDDGTACTGSDFPTTPYGTSTDDTPNQAGATGGNPDGPGTGTVVTDACSNAAPGIMYQNYMDYTDDVALVMFTKGQNDRMEGALTLAPDRNPLLNSLAYLPPPTFPNDAGISSILSPLPTATVCDVTTTPQVVLKNFGNNALTSVKINATANGSTPAGYPFSWTGNLAPGATATVTLPAITLAATTTIVFATTEPNGTTDGNTTNDAKTVVVNRNAVTLPVFEGFESATFPPAPWTVVSVNTTGTRDWVRNTPGNASTGALYIQNFLNASGAIDDFRSGQYPVNSTDSIRLAFDVAYRPYGPSNPDSLLVLVSNDCGATFQEIYKKWGETTAGPNSLGTVFPASTSSFTPASSADWRKETITVPKSLLANGKLQFVFRSKSRFGNNIWIDNINIEKVVSRDLKMTSITSPVGNVCSNTVTPQVVVSNNGLEAITSFTLSYTLNGTPVTPATVVNTSLAPGASTTVTLAPGTVAGTGAQSIAVSVSAVTFASGQAEQETNNNSVSGTFTVVQLRSTIQEGFEGTPTGWTVFNPDGDNTWGIINQGHNSARSVFINNYDNNVVGHLDDVRSPFVNTGTYDSLYVSFDLAHKFYTGSADRLQVMAITGCGTTVVPTGYSKAGATLATAGSSTTSYLTPTEPEWRRETIAIGRSVLGTGNNVIIAFRNTNDYGNNIFIDNINIIPLFRRDLQLVSINQPGRLSCTTSLTPSVTIKNNGSETVTGYKVQYSIDNGAPQTATTVTGVSIPRNGTATINLGTSTLSIGAHTIKVYTFEPVTASGSGDEYTVNDTLSRTFNVLNTVNAPLTENFSGTTFPPANWTVINPDNNITWRRNAVGNRNAGSAYVNTFNYPTNGQMDDLITPFVRYTDADSVKLSFDLSAATYSYPGSTQVPLDTLEILATKDCGATFTTVYKKFGTDLQTISAPNDPQPTEFFPISANQWRVEKIDMSQFAGNGQVALVFRVTNNFENNIFIDNVSLTTQTLPAQLKQQGYVVYPTAFQNSFGIWHYQTPTTLKYVNVVNAAGQLVWTKQFNGNADRQMTVDLAGKAAGMYFVELGYADASRKVVQRVVKY